MRRFLILMMLACLCNCTFAQSVVTGIVRDTIGTALEGVIVRVNADKATLGFARTSENGTYKITLKSDAKQLIVTAEAIGYEKTKREIKNVSQECNFNLKEKTTDLKEVVVKAPAIYQRGDTLSYNLASYIGKNDYTLKDAMKKLPGIEVGEKGSIKYLGKEISNFYINGMDLLGGRYNIATTNIPASFVNSVQVLSNHQAVKANKDVFSDNVAINVNMSNKAKFKPVGSYGVSLGAGEHALYEVNGAGMLFKSNFQMLASLKAGNIKQFALDEGINHFDNKETTSTLSNLLENISASTPPVEVDRYASPTDRLLSFNILRKIRKDVTLKGNIGYSYAKSQYDYSLTRSYADAENNIVITQEYSPLSTVHRPSIQLEYKDNSEKTYLVNTLSGVGSFLTSELPTTENGMLFNQKQTMREFYLSNKFSTLWHHKDLRWSLTSLISYQGSPMGKITLDKEGEDAVVQSANGQSSRIENNLSVSKKYHNSRFYLPFLLNYYMDKIQTTLHPTDESNDESMQNFRMVFAPQYEYAHPQYKYVFRMEVPIRIDYVAHKDHMAAVSSGSWYYSICPSMYCNYKVSSRSVLRTNVFYARTFGDILDFLKSPVRINDISIKMGSGILADTKSLNATLHYDYKIPLKMWFFNADILYSQERSNLLQKQEATHMLVSMSKIYAPNTAKNFMGQVGITKFIESIKTKVSLNGGYQWRRQMTLQNDNQQKYTWKSWTFSPYLTSQPCKYIELDYKGMFAKTYLCTDYQKNNYLSQQHKVALKIMPFEGFTFESSVDIVKNELTKDVTKTMSLLDMGMSYQKKAVKVSLDIRNILNQHQYGYTIYNSVNTFTYNYQLRGRECVCSVKLTI